MAVVEESIDVEVPVRTAYNQWTQFEKFPLFMEGIVEVQQLDDRRVHWVAEVDGVRHSWEAEIVRQEPDRCIVWRSVEGKQTSGEVSFEPLDVDSTRINVQLAYEPDGVKENVGSLMGVDGRRVRADLERFKELIESYGAESGAWRGEIVDRGGAF